MANDDKWSQVVARAEAKRVKKLLKFFPLSLSCSSTTEEVYLIMFDNMIKLVNDEMSSQKECNSYSVFPKTFSLLPKSVENANEQTSGREKQRKRDGNDFLSLSRTLFFHTFNFLLHG